MPVRSSLAENTEVQAAQIIKNLGAAPLVVLRGAVDPNALADDTRIIQDMNRIFGSSIVYYEFGNEEDLAGVDVTSYVMAWNSIVPKLKPLALHGHFIGPVNYQYDRDYLAAFLRQAKPRPDEISWHEYTCDDSWTNSVCISHISHWTNHISDARAVMQATIGQVLPIMITEWNYAPNAVPNDGKNNNPSFMAAWTTLALQTLAANGIFASMQYSVTNTAIPLITSGNALTSQATAFQNQYQTMIVNGRSPTPVPTPPGQPQGGGTPTPGIGGTYSSFSFEDGGTDGWSSHSPQISAVQNSSSTGMGDTHSLQVTFSNMTSNDYPSVGVGRSSFSSYPSAGQTITLYVYLPASSPSIGAKIYLMDSQYHWFDGGSMTTLRPGTWNRLTYTLPGSFNGPLRQLGVQFHTTSSSPVNESVYIDSVSWG